jgi:ribosomal protein S18 acetylase RimI-like enzyme
MPIKNIREMTIDDIGSVVKIHRASFNSFFLTSLGPKFLAVMYREFIASPVGISRVYDTPEGIAGFVIGVESMAGFYAGMIRQNLAEFSMAMLAGFVQNPKAFLQVDRFRSIFRRASEMDRTDSCKLISIAVSPDRQVAGIGRTLLEEFLSEASRRGKRFVTLETDHDHNEAANRFYRENGFKLLRSFTASKGRIMNEYLFDLSELIGLKTS